jgi:aminopeptidase-like protein
LYSGIGGHFNKKDIQSALLWVLNQSDGDNSLVEIADRSGLDLELIHQASLSLHAVGLLEELKI